MNLVPKTIHQTVFLHSKSKNWAYDGYSVSVTFNLSEQNNKLALMLNLIYEMLVQLRFF
jgi:hypothetical protein